MPELPEAETVRRTLLPLIQNKIIRKVEVNNSDVLDNISAEDFIKVFTNNSVSDISRKGKYLILELKSKDRVMMHLRMTGQVFAINDTSEIDKHCHVVFYFDDGGFCYRDVRRFGRFALMGTGSKVENGFMALGPEPMDDEFTAAYIENAFKKSRCPIKTKLLDQHFTAGIGNIYADEILFAAGIHPETPCGEISRDKIEAIIEVSRTILNNAIKNRGTTFRDYRDGNGNLGDNQNHLMVFRRWDQPCYKCGTIIAKTKCAGRTTSYCPECQKKL